MWLWRAWKSLTACFFFTDQSPLAPSNHISSYGTPAFTFSPHWRILGPFQLGTREAAWGSDPLEQYGGFRALEYNPHVAFRNSLAINGTVSWSRTVATVRNPDVLHATVNLDVGFPDVEWQALRDIYGWAAMQWQAWARGEIIVHSDEVESLYLSTPSLLELWIDDVHYFGGDFYQYDRAPVSLRLTPGAHRVDVRLVRDVRSMGGFGGPAVKAQLDLRKSSELLHVQGRLLISDFVEDGRSAILAGPYASAMFRNDAQHEIELFELVPTYNECVGELLAKVRILPGQSRPVAFRISCVGMTSRRLAVRVVQTIKYRFVNVQHAMMYNLSAHIPIRSSLEPHKITFLHPAGVVSYAILRPPSHKAEESQPANSSLPILVGLHGAGVEAEDDLVKHALDSLPDLPAWVLFPTGGSPWSGDDWHAWGLADLEAATAMIPEWIERSGWQGSGVLQSHWLVSGHSNGGQGAWHVVTHRPDNVFAAAVLSGYSSIQNYVPYTFWQVADPGRVAVMNAALSTYRHELLLANTKGIPLMQQHGGLDDNVPTYNARLMSQLLHEAESDSGYVEFPGRSHVWEGVFATEPLKEFYESHLPAVNKTKIRRTDPLKPRSFAVVTTNPGDIGPKNGVHILQLATPGQIGRVDVMFHSMTLECTVETTNIRMFQLPPYFRECSAVLIDNQKLPFSILNTDLLPPIVREDSTWRIHLENPKETLPRPSRTGRQLGAMDAILRTRGAFQIVPHSNTSGAHHIALQISRNLCQYYAADTIINPYTEALSSPGNVISVAIGPDLPQGSHARHPLHIENGNEIQLRAHPHSTRFADPHAHGLAAIFLRPLPNERLELVVWGADEASLAVAARLVPMLPGTGTPDFVVMDRRMMWKGLEGARALGFFDSDWEVSSNSFVAG